MEARIYHPKAPMICHDCGASTVTETYIVRNEIWDGVAHDVCSRLGCGWDGVARDVYSRPGCGGEFCNEERCSGELCVSCLEHRLGRRLTAEDFPMDIPLNWFGEAKSRRLQQRMGDALRMGALPLVADDDLLF
jgi:hypothetical protein